MAATIVAAMSQAIMRAVAGKGMPVSSGWHGTSLTYRSYIRRISLARLRLLRPPTIEPRPAIWHWHQAKSDREGLMMRVTGCAP